MAIHAGMCCLTASYVHTAKVCDATDFQYQTFSSLDKYDTGNHVTTTVEVGVMSSPSTQRGLANWQHGHVIIEIYYYYYVLTRLTGRLHSSKFYSSKSLATPFVKILHHQTFVPYSSHWYTCVCMFICIYSVGCLIIRTICIIYTCTAIHNIRGYMTTYMCSYITTNFYAWNRKP